MSFQPPRSARDRLIIPAIVAAGFTLVVLGSGGQNYLYETMRAGEDVAFWENMLWPAIFWYLWAVVTPFVFAVVERTRLDTEFTGRRIALLAAGCAGVVVLHIGLQAASMALPVYHDLHADLADAISFHFFTTIHINLITVALLVGAWYAGNYYHTLRKREVRQAALESQLSQAELRSLKMQIQPHFLFNTLNGISELMNRDVPKAERVVSNLSGLLRSSIYGTGDPFVSLEDEISFVRRYLEIEQIRYGDRLHVQIVVEDDVREVLVPCFILQPFAENAVKHGAAKLSREVHIRIRGRMDRNRLNLEISDDGAGLTTVRGDGHASPAPDTSTQGVGIANVGRRLDHLFGDEYAMRLEEREQGFTVTIELPILTDHPA